MEDVQCTTSCQRAIIVKHAWCQNFKFFLGLSKFTKAWSSSLTVFSFSFSLALNSLAFARSHKFLFLFSFKIGITWWNLNAPHNILLLTFNFNYLFMNSFLLFICFIWLLNCFCFSKRCTYCWCTNFTSFINAFGALRSWILTSLAVTWSYTIHSNKRDKSCIFSSRTFKFTLKPNSNPACHWDKTKTTLQTFHANEKCSLLQ